MAEKPSNTDKQVPRRRGQGDQGKALRDESFEKKDRNTVFDTLEPPAPRPRPSRGN